MLKCAVLGLGNCGGNIAWKVHETMKFDVMVINTSANDLSGISDIFSKLFGDGKGVGKDREESKRAFKADIKDIMSDPETEQIFDDKDIIFVVSSCGGGTGSGVAFITATVLSVSYPKSIIIPIGVMPLLSEGMGSQLNFLDYYADLRGKASTMPYMLYDNNKYANLPHKQIIETVNNKIVNDITVLTGYYNNSTNLDSIDERDLQTILSAPGRIVVGSVTDIKERDVDDLSIEDMLLADIKTGAHAEMQRDRRVTATGVISCLSSRIPFNPMIPDVHEVIGVPTDTFQHIHINADKNDTNNVFLIMSGLSIPRDRKDRAAERVKAMNEAQNAIAADDDEDDMGSYRELQKKRVRANRVDTAPARKDITYDDVFSQYGL